MASFTFRNNLDSFLPVSFIANEIGDIESITLSGKEVRTVTASSLTFETQNLVDKRYLSLLDSEVAESVDKNPKNGLPLIYGFAWLTNLYYPEGWVVSYSGINYLVIQKHLSSTIPPNDTDNYAVLSISSPESFFGVEVTDWNTDETLVKTNTGWKAALIASENVSAISISKITNLQTELDSKLDSGGTNQLTITDAPTAGTDAVNKTYVDNTFVAKAGGIMTGLLTLSGNPSADYHATPKLWVATNFLSKSGGVMTGPITGTHGLISQSGGTMLGALTLASAPSATLHAANKGYVDTAAQLWKGGGTMTGVVLLSETPDSGDSALQAATKGYVDTAVTNLLSTTAGGDITGDIDFQGAATINGINIATEVFVQSSIEQIDIEVVSTTTFTHQGTAIFSSTAQFDGINVFNGSATFNGVADFNQPVDFSDETTFGADMDAGGNLIHNVATPVVGTDAANKDYVDDNSFSILAGVDNTLQGPLALLSTSSNETGLYEDDATGKLAYKGTTVVTRSQTVEVASDYTVTNAVALVLVNTNQNIVSITIPPSATESDILVQKISGTGIVVISGKSTIAGSVLTVLQEIGESVTISPLLNDTTIEWRVTSRVIPDKKCVAARMSLSGSVTTRNDRAGSVNVGGYLGLNFNSGGVYSNYKIGDVVKLTDCNPPTYSGKYLDVLTVDSINNRVTLNDTYLSMSCSINLKYQDISVQAYRKEHVFLSVTAISNSDGFAAFRVAPVAANGLARSVESVAAYTSDNESTAGLVAGDQILVRGHDDYNTYGRVTAASNGLITTDITYVSATLTDTIVEVTKLVIPQEGDSESMNLTYSDSTSNKFSNKFVNITGITSTVDGAVLDVDSSSGVDIGTNLRVLGTGIYDGFRTVVGVPNAEEITIDLPYAGNATGKFINTTRFGGENNISTTLGNTIFKNTYKNIASLRTGVNGTATVRVSGWNDCYLSAFSSGWVNGEVGVITDTKGSGSKFAATLSTLTSSGNPTFYARLVFVQTMLVQGIKAGDYVTVSSLTYTSPSGSIPAGDYLVLSVEEGSNRFTINYTYSGGDKSLTSGGTTAVFRPSPNVSATTVTAIDQTFDNKAILTLASDYSATAQVGDRLNVGTISYSGGSITAGNYDILEVDGYNITIDTTYSLGSQSASGNVNLLLKEVILFSTNTDLYLEDTAQNGVGVIIESDSEIIADAGTSYTGLVTDRLGSFGFTINKTLAPTVGALSINCQSIQVVSSAKIALS